MSDAPLPREMSVITELPLCRLTSTHGEAMHVGDVGNELIRDLLRSGVVRFVVADVGTSLRWIPESECFDFWKHEVQPHLVEPGQRVSLDQVPGQYAYFTSQWDDGSSPIVLLSKTH